jgi:hypothetical protein
VEEEEEDNNNKKKTLYSIWQKIEITVVFRTNHTVH